MLFSALKRWHAVGAAAGRHLYSRAARQRCAADAHGRLDLQATDSAYPRRRTRACGRWRLASKRHQAATLGARHHCLPAGGRTPVAERRNGAYRAWRIFGGGAAVSGISFKYCSETPGGRRSGEQADSPAAAPGS